MRRDWGVGNGQAREQGARENNSLPPFPLPLCLFSIPNAQLKCAAIRSKGQSHISHDLDKLDSVSLQYLRLNSE